MSNAPKKHHMNNLVTEATPMLPIRMVQVGSLRNVAQNSGMMRSSAAPGVRGRVHEHLAASVDPHIDVSPQI